jgi:hypothetical protein
MTESATVVEEMNKQAEIFRTNAAVSTKASAARARKATSALRDLGKIYRKLSVAEDK